MPEPSPPDPARVPAPARPPATKRLRVSSTCVIGVDEITWRFTTSGGPGGQHANKVATRAEARFDVEASPSLTENQRRLLLDKVGPVVIVAVDETRSQTRNRSLALARMVDKLGGALVRPVPRRPTKPSKAAKARRLDEKRRQGETKKGRSRRPSADD